MIRLFQHRLNRTASVISCVALSLSLLGCFTHAQPPAVVHFQRFEIEVPQGRPDIIELSASDDDDLMVVEFCNLQSAPTAMKSRFKPRDHAIGDVRGFRTILSRPFFGLERFQNRPLVVTAPQAVPLLRYSAAPGPDNLSDPEQHQFFRLRSFAATKGPIMTTDAGWPLVHCEPKTTDQWCTVGFQIEGAFVESSWRHVGPLTQAEIWRIASGINAKIRECIKPLVC